MSDSVLYNRNPFSGGRQAVETEEENKSPITTPQYTDFTAAAISAAKTPAPRSPGYKDYSALATEEADAYKAQRSALGAAFDYMTPVTDTEYGIISRNLLAIADEGGDVDAASYRWATAIEMSRYWSKSVDSVMDNFDDYYHAWTGKEFAPTKSNFLAIVDSFKVGQLQNDLADVAARWKASGGGDGYKDELQAITQQIDALKDNTPRSWVIEAMKYGAASAPFTFRTMAAGGIAAAGVGLAATGLGASAGTIAALKAGASFLGSFASSLITMAALDYYDMRQMGVSHQVAAPISNTTGIINGIIESSLGNVAGMAGKLGGGAIDSIAGNVAKRFIISGQSGAFARGLMRYVGETAEEGVEEFLQQITSDIGKNIAAEAEGQGIPTMTAAEIGQDAAQAFVGGVAGAVFLGVPGAIIGYRGDARQSKILHDFASVSEKDTFIKTAESWDSVQSIPEGKRKAALEEIWNSAQKKTTKEELSEEEPPAQEPTSTPEEQEVFAKRAAEKLPEGTVIQSREEIEGEQYVLKAGNKDSGERLGFVRYEIDPDNRTVNILGFQKGSAPNVNAFLLRGLDARFAGWTIELDTKTRLDAALREYMTQNNPRGPEAGIQWYEAPRETPDRVSVEYVKQRIRDIAPSWSDEDVEVAAKTLPMWARKLGMTADELADAALDPRVFGTILDKRGVAAQAATGAFRPIRVSDGWFKGIIDMSARANPSTAIHEMTHAVVNFARQAQNVPQVAQFLQELEGALGVKDGDWDAEFSGWTEEYKGGNRSFMEALTYGMEDYFLTGKAPKPELESLFHKLAQWILDIYEGLKGARVKMSPEMTAYFDNLIGGEGSPFVDERQSLNEQDLETEDRTLSRGMPGQGVAQDASNEANVAQPQTDASTAQFERPSPEGLELYQNKRRREIAGARRDLTEAQRLAAEGKTPEEIRAETGWRQVGDEWRLDKSFETRPEYETDADERERQEGQPAAEEALGPAQFEEKGYLSEGPTEDAPDPWTLYQGEWGKKLETEEGNATQAIETLLREKEGWAEHVVYRDELGYLDIPWGTPGNLDKDYAGGWGLSHIQAKHEYTDEVIGKLPKILRAGRVVQDPEFRNRRDIILGKYKAIVQLTRDGQTSPWLVTAYTPEEWRRRGSSVGEGQQTAGAIGSRSSPPAGSEAARSPAANGRRVIVRRKPRPGNSLDRNNIKPDGTLYQAEPSPVFSAAIAEHGVTDDIREAGFILPDGRLIDLSGKNQDEGYTREGDTYKPKGVDYLAGKKMLAHSDVTWKGAPKKNLARDMLINLGAVRVDAKYGILEIGRAPTPDQMGWIRQVIENNKETKIEVADGDRNRYFEVDNPTKGIGYIRRFYAGEEMAGVLFQGNKPALNSKQISDLAQLAEYGLDGEYKDLEGEARRVLEDAGVDYLDGYHVIKNEDQDNVRREGLKGSEWYGKPSGVYFLADPDDLGLAYPYVVGKMVSQKNKETMAVIHFRIPIDEIKNIQWDGKFNATFGTYSSFLNKGDIRPDQIVEIQHADFPTADEWNEKTKIPLYQGDVASSESLLYQAGDGDEAGLSNLKDIAHSFETWEEFASFVETMEVQNPSIPQDMSTIERQGWYKELWTQARQVNPIDLDDWVQRLEADNHAGLYDFLEGIWNEVLVPGSMRVFEGAEELSVAEKARGTKGELAETIVAGAQRVGSGKRNLDPRFIASLMGTIRKNPEEYARIYGQVMDQPEVGRLGAEAEKAKYADIEDPRLKTNRMSISQRAALASQIRDEKLAADVLTGRVAMDEKAKTYLDKLRSAQKAAKKKIADLTAELKVDEATLDEQDRRLAASRAESARTSQEIARAKKRIERFVEKGQKVPKGYESKLKTQEERAKALRSQLARIGDYEELDRQKRRLEERLSRAELQAEEYRARGEATPLTLLRLRSELREQLRTLEPRLKAAGERWKDNAGLASYIAKAEAIAKEREKYQVREAEKRAFAKIRKYQKSLVNQIMRAPDERMYVAQQKAILEIQQLIDPAWRSEKTQEQVDELRAELEKNPEISREIPKEWLRRATGKNLNEMTLQELEETARKVDDLRTLGRVLKNRQDRARADWSEARVAEIIDAIEHSPGYKAPTGYEPEKDFLERFKDKVRTLDYSFLNMRRIANRLDGGTDGTNVKLLWHEMNRNYRKEMEGIDRRTQTIMQAFTDAGVKPEEWYNTSVTVQGAGPGGAAKVLRKSDLLALELAFRNEDSRAAALYGNFFSATERKQHEKDEDWFMVQGGARFEALRAAIDSVLTPADQKILDAMSSDAQESGGRLAEVVASVENRILQIVDSYFPIFRQNVTQEPIDVQIASDLLNRTPGLKRPPRNGMTKSRIAISPAHQTPIKLDLLSTWLSSIQAQEHYIAYAEYGKKLDSVYTNSYMQEQIKAVLGDPGVDYVKEYIAEVKNPGDLRNRSRWENSIRYVRGNLGAAYLTFRASSVLKQIITSPWPALPYAGPRMLSESMKCLANPVAYLRETEDLSTVLKHRQMNLVVQAIKEAEASSPAGKALLGAEKMGMKGLELADRFSVAIGWRAVYEKALNEFKGDTAKAVEKADDIILKTQPSARGVDLAPIYRKGGEGLRLLLQFTQAMNVIYQNLRYDVPNAVKQHQFGTAVGILMSYAIAGVLLGAATQGFDDDDDPEKKAQKLMFWSITQGTDSLPLIGQYATRVARRAVTGEKAPTYPSSLLPGIEDIMEGTYRLTGGEIDKAIEKFAIGGGIILGMPTSGIKELSRVVSGDFGALAGRPEVK